MARTAPGRAATGASPPLRPAPTPAGDSTPAQFARFVLVGGSANAVYAGLFLVLAPLGDQAANLVGVVASTALANELHRRLTFRAGDRAGWAAAQWAGGGLAVAGLATSSLTLAALESWADPAGPLVPVLAVCAVSGAVGLVRFGGLRWVLVVRPGPGARVPAVHTS
ncbi:putative flippase GtrA [Geodermatophilus tzadiensis]|uniref:Putative flippase GtrA n=1 Tax=Geodermatophilus tzadiensis TaxID=1137988 RepID=A0A2T0TRW0_9ACTN|nr:GtrA family protein [Geodermatophilus tzadiensis]PRY48397.1 putative flippase GtrA [Geodermatophilus tzadiensis]